MTDRYAAYHSLVFDRPSERVLRITMARPDRLNAADRDLHRQLAEVWREIDRDPDVSVAVIRGAGRGFSAGGDFEYEDVDALAIGSVSGLGMDASSNGLASFGATGSLTPYH